MAFTNIVTPKIDVVELREIAADLLEELVHGDASPFKDMLEQLETYLDTAPDLDATQKAGIFADTLKSMYKDINGQVLSTGIEVLKANGTFELERYKTEASYNITVAGLPKITEEIIILAKQGTLLDAQIVELNQNILNSKGVYLEQMAKLKKQYGYPSANTTTLDLGLSSGVGAIDKQIRGYDMVNLKDTLKTMDERAALMQNAKVPETTGEKLMRKELMEAITGAAITTDGSGNITSVSNIVV